MLLKYVVHDPGVRANGENDPCVALPLRVMVRLLVLLSKNVLFCPALTPVPGNNSTVLAAYGAPVTGRAAVGGDPTAKLAV